MYAVRHRGMGQAAVIPANAGFLQQNLETINACNSAAYWIDPFCWGYSPAAWAEAAQYAPLQGSTTPVPPAAVASGLSTEPAPLTQEEYDQQTSDVLNAALAQTQANTLAASQNQPTVCGSGQTLADDGVTCVTTATSWILYGALALVAVFAVVSLSGGSPRRYGR